MMWRARWLWAVLGLALLGDVLLGLRMSGSPLVTAPMAVANTFANGITLLLIRFVPPRLAPIPLVEDRPRHQLWSEVLWCLVVVVLVIGVVLTLTTLWLLADPRYVLSIRSPFLTWNYFVSFAIQLIAVIALVRRIGGGARELGLAGITERWRWIGPAVYVLVYAGLVLLVLTLSLRGRAVHGASVGTLAFAWIFVILAASFPEEFLYRVLLQTRLEALLGRWNGIALASLVFALSHFPSRLALVWLPATHSAVPLAVLLTLASVITVQGSAGFQWGYLWSRYRNAWLQVLLHTLTDGIGFTLIVLGVTSQIQ